MGLFDRIKKAFSGEQNEEPEKQEEVVEDQSVSEDRDEVETGEVVETPSNEEATADTDEEQEGEPEESSDQIEKSMELPQEIPTQELKSDDLEVKEEPVDSAIGSEKVQVEQTEIESTPIELKTESESIEVSELESENIVPAEPEQPEETVQEKYDKGLEKTRKSFGERMNELFARFRRVDEDFFEDLEETLIGADVGFDTAIKLTDSLRQEVKLKNAKKPAQVQNVIIEKLVDIYEAEGINENNAINLQNDGLSVILFVGVNGTGKTTSIGKLANQYKNEGKKVLLAAADTFRAGAIDQLVVWGQRSGVEVVRGNAGGDPAAVVFDAVDKAK